MADLEPVFLGIAEQARRFRSGELSPVALVEAYLARIERLDPDLRAFITVCADDARRQAETATRELRTGRARSPLHGIPFAVKDQMLIDGVRVTGGSRVLADHIGDRDATVVARLKATGAILLGTLNTHEFHSGPTRDFPYGLPRNPWNRDRTPGASSAGSASAVAAGLCSFSLGGDTGGSIRAPAAYCGVVGLKATWSRVSRDGVFPLAWSMDCVGPLTRTVADAALVLSVIAGYDPRDPTSSELPVPAYADALGGDAAGDLTGLRIGVVDEMRAPGVLGRDAVAAADAALDVLRDLGAEIVPVSIPLVKETRVISTALVHSEAASYHRKWLTTRYLDYDVSTRIGFMVGGLLPAALRGQAERMRTRIAKQVMHCLDEVDVLAGPTADGATPLEPSTPTSTLEAAMAFLTMPGRAAGPQTRVYSLAGTPAVSVPCGFDRDGLPLGLQLATRHFDETTLLRTAHAYEAQTPWHDRHPGPAA